jgi:hypothetical protein
MKTLGQIAYEASASPEVLRIWSWDNLPQWEKDIMERGAQAVAEEVIRRQSGKTLVNEGVKWTKEFQRRFDQLAALEAMNELTDANMREFRPLIALRRLLIK